MNRFKSVKNIQEIIYRIYYKLPDDLHLYCKTCGKKTDKTYCSEKCYADND